MSFKSKIFIFVIFMFFVFFIFSCIQPFPEDTDDGEDTKIKYTELFENIWNDGSLKSKTAKWYYFDASSDNQYLIIWDDKGQGTGTKECDIKISVYTEDKTKAYFANINSGFTTSRFIKAYADEKVYIKVDGLTGSEKGSFSLKYSSFSPVLLTQDIWNDSSLMSSETKWYYFESTNGSSYNILWDDKTEGSGTKNCDIKVSSFRENQTTNYFLNQDNAYNFPKIITSSGSELIYFKVEGSTSAESGSFSLKYEISTPPKLTIENYWYEDNLQIGQERWYYFDGVAGSSYNIWLDDISRGSTEKTGDMTVSVYMEDMITPYFINIDTSFYEPQIINVINTEKVYIKISTNNQTAFGSFAFKFKNSTPVKINLENVWYEDIIDSYDVKWFYFDVIKDNYYHIWWDDKNYVSKTKTADIVVSAYREDQATSYFLDSDYIHSSPKTIQAAASERIYLKIKHERFNSSIGTYSLKFKHINPLNLSLDNNWKKENINAFDANWFYFNLKKDEYYYIWWDDKKSGSGSETCDIEVSIFYEELNTNYINDSYYFHTYDDGYYFPRIIKLDADCKVFIRVEGYKNTENGSYSLKIKQKECIELTDENLWYDDSIFYKEEKKYIINGTIGDTFEIYWDNLSDGSGMKTADIRVSGYYSTGNWFFYNEDNGYNIPKKVILGNYSTDGFYLNVKGDGSSRTSGTYAIKYIKYPPTQLNNSVWFDNEIEYFSYQWYSFDSIKGNSYNIWIDDFYNGSGTKTARVLLYAYNENGECYFEGVDNNYNVPKTIIATGSKIYLKVYANTSGSDGTYGIKYEILQ